LVVHLFSANGSVADLTHSTNEMESYLGTELDFSIGYALAKGVSFAAGYSQMMATESLEVIKGGSSSESNNWAWVMVTFKPSYLVK
jgi:hypothetical protein